jgi:NitT/TauT family transport system substrate-binding protein
MGFIANVQYAPFYVAVEKGYFVEHGIEIEFDYSFETDGVKLVGAGELPFAVVSGEQVVLARSQDLPVVYVMQWFRKFPIAVVGCGDTVLNGPQDLAGKTVGLPGFFGASFVGWRGLLYKSGIEPSQVTEQDIGFNQVAVCSEERAQVVVGYANNEPIQLRQAGLEPSVLLVSDYVDMVANGLMTNEQTIQDQPELVGGMVRAILRGLKDTIEDPDEAFQITTKYVTAIGHENAQVQRLVLDESIKMWQSPRLGLMDPAAWETTAEVLAQMGQITAKPDVGRLFTNFFVETAGVQDDE